VLAASDRRGMKPSYVPRTIVSRSLAIQPESLGRLLAGLNDDPDVIAFISPSRLVAVRPF
jgi:hypothetical protein